MRITLAAIAAWPPANHVNPEVLGPGNTVLLCILQTLVTALIAIRLYTRLKMSTGYRLDDTLIVLAYIPTTGYAIGGIYQELVLKVDRHIWDFPLENSEAAFKLGLAQLILFCGATTLTKLSTLALIHRITTAAGDRTARTLTVALATVVSLDGVVFVIVELTQCRPLSLYWTPFARQQNCINEPVHLLAAGIINTVTDFLIVLLPIRTVLNLDLPRRQLLVVQGLLAGGILATIAGAVRTKYAWDVVTAPDFDITWRLHLTISLSAVELYLGIVCASLAATKPFFQHFIPRLLGRSDLTEPLSLKKSSLSHDDGGSVATLRPSATSLAGAATIPKPARLSKTRRGGGGDNLATAQPRFVWRPVISPPVISSPITPTFLVRDQNRKGQSLEPQPWTPQRPVPGSTPPWQYPEANLVPIASFSTATPMPAAAATEPITVGFAGEDYSQQQHLRRGSVSSSMTASSTAAVLPLALGIPTTTITTAFPPRTPLDLNKPLPALDYRSSAVVEPLHLPAANGSRSRPLTTYGSSAGTAARTTQMPGRRSSAPRMPSSLIYEPSMLAGGSSSSSGGGGGGGGTQSHMCSVYDFMAYDDGHISVHKTSRVWATPPARD